MQRARCCMKTPPSELNAIGLDVAHFRYAGSDEWHGPCPRCGGRDRFVVFADRPFPSWRWLCRVCSPDGGWVDELNPRLKEPISAEKRAEWARERERQERERERIRQEIINGLTLQQAWEIFHDKMQTAQREWWRSQGVPDEWQDYLRLGYIPDHTYMSDGQLYQSPVYTIPYFRENWALATMQYRIANPINPADKYRFSKGLTSAYYMTQPDQPIGDKVLICEGAKKAIVTVSHADLDADTTVLSVPSKSDNAGIVQAVQACGRVWVALDPDAGTQAEALARKIGPAARVVELPGKIDDALLAGSLTGAALNMAMRAARKV